MGAIARCARAHTQVLVHILMSSHDPTTLAVAANDLAQFVKFHDGAKKCAPSPSPPLLSLLHAS